MSEFRAVVGPGGDLVDALAAQRPRDVFATRAYAEACAAMGATVVLFGTFDGERLVTGCLASLLGSRLRRRLEITACPALDDPGAFWSGVMRFCRRHLVWEIEANSFGAERTTIPTHATEVARRERAEYVLDLTRNDLVSAISTNHRRNAAKARRADVRVVRVASHEACLRHIELMGASMTRRAGRGEAVPDTGDARTTTALVGAGAAELYQAVRGEEVLSSILIVRSATGAYYQSAGTSPSGMEVGASTFLVAETAALLRSAGVERFSLGGAGEESGGLKRFKTGFGATAVPLTAARFAPMPRVVRQARTAVRLAAREPGTLARSAVRVDRFVVYAADPRTTAGSAAVPHLRAEKLSDADLQRLADGDGDLAEELRRRRGLPFNAAYAVLDGDEVAHVAWLVTPDEDRLVRGSNVGLRDGEAEITHCFTPEAFRGRGVYAFAIRALCGIAAARGIRRVVMITNVRNVASQRGIEKAGLRRCGSIVRVALPWLSDRASVALRPFRWPLGAPAAPHASRVPAPPG